MSKDGEKLIEKLNSLGITPRKLEFISNYTSLEKLSEEKFEEAKEELEEYGEELEFSFQDFIALGIK